MLDSIIIKVKQCSLCHLDLPYHPNPIFQLNSKAKILIIGQAPGLKTHLAIKPFADESGKRLRMWMNVSQEQFYDMNTIAIMPMAFCYPGKAKTGDNPPPLMCSQTWHRLILNELKNLKLIILIGKYAIKKYLPSTHQSSIREVLQNPLQHLPYFPIPHPSPRNNIWLAKNSWFEKEIIPLLKEKIKEYG